MYNEVNMNGEEFDELNYNTEDFSDDLIKEEKLKPTENLDDTTLIRKTKDRLKKEFVLKVRNFVNEVISEYYPVTINELKPELYLYREGYYHPLAENMLQQMCNDRFKHANTPALFKEISHKIKSYKMIDRSNFLEPNNKINLLNGVLNVYTKELELHNPYYNFLYKLNIRYDPEAKCPNIMKFLEDICSNDNEKLSCLCEFLGFCLISDYPIKKFMMILGRGDNGKSTLEYIIRHFLGNEKNVTGLTIQDICDSQFLASRLYGKRLNIRGEMRQLKLASIEMLKSLTGGDIVTVDRKNRDMIDLHPSCKFLFHFNKLPLTDIRLMDNQSWKRILLLELTNKFTGNTENKNIRNSLTTDKELEGLLNLALIGLDRLRENRCFTYNDDLTFDRWIDYLEIDHENPLANFVDEYLSIGELGSCIPQTILYEIYLKSQYSKLTMLSKNMFTRSLTSFPGVGVAKKGSREKRYMTYEGVKLKIPTKKSEQTEILSDVENNEVYKCTECRNEIEYLQNCKHCGTKFEWV